MNIVASDVISPDVSNLVETGVKAYDQEIINQNSQLPILLFVGILLLANA